MCLGRAPTSTVSMTAERLRRARVDLAVASSELKLKSWQLAFSEPLVLKPVHVIGYCWCIDAYYRNLNFKHGRMQVSKNSMCVCICVCLHEREPTYQKACIRARMHGCMHGCMHACTCVCAYASMPVCVYVCMYVCMYLDRYAHLFACLFICMCVRMYVRIYVCTYVCM